MEDVLYYGYSRKYWNNIGLDEETAGTIGDSSKKQIKRL